MYWIKTGKGNGINLALATDVVLYKIPGRDPEGDLPTHSVRVYFAFAEGEEGNVSYTSAGYGKQADMAALRDRIVADLLRATAESRRYQIDHVAHGE